MTDRRCDNCSAWRPINEPRTGGECRRFAPRPKVAPPGTHRTRWPLTAAVDWCGQHQAIAAGDLA